MIGWTVARLLRLGLYAATIYFFFRVAFPEGDGRVYHWISPPLLFGGAMGMFMFIKFIDINSRAALWGLEALFAAGVFLYVGLTMPQTKGKAPLEQLMAGERPTRSTVRTGVSKLGLDANGKAAGAFIDLFPTH